MAFIILTNPETAAAFEALTEYDQFIDVPARQGYGNCYRGMISNITPEAAEKYVKYGGNLIKKKEAPAAAVQSSPVTMEGSVTAEASDAIEHIDKKIFKK